MPKQKNEEITSLKFHFIKKNKIRILTLAFVFLALFATYSSYYTNRIVPGIYFSGKNMMGMSRPQADTFVSEMIGSFENTPVVIDVRGVNIQFKTSDLGISFDRQKTASRLMAFGRGGKPSEVMAQRVFLPFKPVSVSPVYTVDYDRFSNTLRGALASYLSEAQNATIDVSGSKPFIVNEKSGKVIDESLLIADLKRGIDNLNSFPIQAKIVDVQPLVTKEQAQRALEKVQELNDRNISLVFGYDKWTLTGDNLLSILKFQAAGYEDDNFVTVNLGEPVSIRRLGLSNSSLPDLDLSLDQRKVDDLVGEIALSLNKPTVNATLKFENGKVTKFQPAQDGQKLDISKTKEILLSKVSIDNISDSKNNAIQLPVSVTKAEISNPEVNTLGIKELIGRGVSYYAGSIPNRIFNIGLGASLISGALVPPGEVFSFDKLVGPVSAAQGFRKAYVISSGRTVLDDGGGICQVSTTVFRAALNAGLPILERTAHAYRVSYYEQRGFGPGLDATIWSPSVDLKFKNDTDRYILIQAITDPANAKLEVDIYGTSDGRRVEISEPVVTNQVPPPPPLYQDDPTLPKGTVKQVDFAAWGAKSVFTQKVYRGGQLVIDKTFYSNFKPWQAVFLVGTG